jgi:hypothetical protein
MADDASLRRTTTRPQFGLKAMLVAVTAVAVAISLFQWFRTDTIFHSDSRSALLLPNGQSIPTNRWIAGGDLLKLGFLMTDRKNEYLLIQGDDSANVVLLTIGDEKYEAVVTDCRLRRPYYRGEYWIRPGNRVEPSSADRQP